MMIYFGLGMIITIIRLWVIIKFKIGLDGRRWKVFWLTALCFETITLWPIDLVMYAIYLIVLYCKPMAAEAWIEKCLEVETEEDSE